MFKCDICRVQLIQKGNHWWKHDPLKAKKVIEAIASKHRGKQQTVESNSKRSVSLRQNYAKHPELRTLLSEAQKKSWTIERRQKYSLWMIEELGRNIERRDVLKRYFLKFPEKNSSKASCQVGEKNANWRGGTSCLPYDKDFDSYLKKYVQERDSWKCQVCGISNEISLLHVHHIDYNKENSIASNLITLCHSCHEKTNSKREYWREKLSKLIISRNKSQVASFSSTEVIS